jgi:uncharacterized protein (DUF1684 family)
MKNCIFIALLLLFMIENNSALAQSKIGYLDQINSWHNNRINRLKVESGWLNLIGLFWLKPGKNYFGSDSANNLICKSNNMPAVAGYFEMDEKLNVTWHTANGVVVTVKNETIKTALIFNSDSADNAPLLALGSLRWNIIKREDKIGIRLRDLESPVLKVFNGIERYPVDSAWCLTAQLLPATQPEIPINNVIGQTVNEKTAGKLEFVFEGKKYHLDALDEGDDLFVIFSDATSGKGTYPAGRFVYAKRTANGENIVLDFNKAYNPPCSFTDFATCPLPPMQNRLKIAIKAGEKSEGHH